MSPTTLDDVHDFPAAATKPRRSFARWLHLELRANVQHLRRWLRHRADMRALQALDDRMLRDIGLDRGNIDSALDGRR